MRHTLIFHTSNLGRKIQKFVAFKSPFVSLSYSESYALIIIDSEKNVTQTQIAAKLNLDPASVVSLIDELEKHELVKRENLSSDRRKHTMMLTAKGQQIANQIKKQAFKLDTFLKEKLSTREAQHFNMILDKVNFYLNQWKGGEK